MIILVYYAFTKKNLLVWHYDIQGVKNVYIIMSCFNDIKVKKTQ